MNGKPISQLDRDKAIKLRTDGLSIAEISKRIGRGYGTVHRLIRHIRTVRRNIRYGSVTRSLEAWKSAKIKARNILINNPTFDSRIYLLAGIYWGEGDKREVGLINTDPDLIKCFVDCLVLLGISKNEIKVSLRLFEDLDCNECVDYWSKRLSIDSSIITISEILVGNKKGKLKYGMCRVRVAKSGQYFKLIMSLINEIKTKQLLP